MTEQEFANSIDCKFPYAIPEECSALIDLGMSISPNAAFMVLHELCRPPRSTDATQSTLHDLIALWRQRFSHPLADNILIAANALLAERELECAECIRIMRMVSAYTDQYAALSIVYFACDDKDGWSKPNTKKLFHVGKSRLHEGSVEVLPLMQKVIVGTYQT